RRARVPAGRRGAYLGVRVASGHLNARGRRGDQLLHHRGHREHRGTTLFVSSSQRSSRHQTNSMLFSVSFVPSVVQASQSSALSAETIATCKRADAVLLGAVGGPKWDNPNAVVRPEQGLLGIRKTLGLYANIRPVTPYPRLAVASPMKPEVLRDVDLIVVRELT